jgi:hypothetical protein
VRVALFVEGSSDVGIRRTRSWLEQIWNGQLVAVAGRAPFSLVAPISKKDIVAMTQEPRPTGSEPLDMKLARLGAGTVFDAAVVAWDLHPRWNPAGSYCRWDETVQLLDCLAASSALPGNWQSRCAERAREYRARTLPSDRLGPPSIEHGVVLPCCMDPEFESLLAADEAGVLRALRLTARPDGWPRSSSDHKLPPEYQRDTTENPRRLA